MPQARLRPGYRSRPRVVTGRELSLLAAVIFEQTKGMMSMNALKLAAVSLAALALAVARRFELPRPIGRRQPHVQRGQPGFARLPERTEGLPEIHAERRAAAEPGGTGEDASPGAQVLGLHARARRAEVPGPAVLGRARVVADRPLERDRSALAGLPGGAEGLPERPAGQGPVAASRAMSRRVVIAAASVVVIGAAAVAAFALPSGGSNSPTATIDNSAATRLATVRRRSLTSQTQGSATLGYAGSGTVVAPAGAGGTYTRLPKPGDVVREGHPLYWVDGEPVILLYGSVPQWRPL